MSIEEHKQAVMRLLEEVMNKGDLQAVDELVADDYRLTEGQDFRPARRGSVPWRTCISSGNPDLHMTVEQMISRGRPGCGPLDCHRHAHRCSLWGSPRRGRRSSSGPSRGSA